MKKIALVLAMILCMVPVFSACGATSSPEGAVEAALNAYYVDFDYESFSEVCYAYNQELCTEYLVATKDYTDSLEDIQDNLNSLTKKLSSASAENALFDDVEFNYEIRYVETYEAGEFAFTTMLKKSDLDTAYKALIDQVAVVRVIGEMVYTTMTDAEIIRDFTGTYNCYCIDGSWYVDWETLDFGDAVSAIDPSSILTGALKGLF